MKTIESIGWLAAALLAVGCSSNTVALDGGGSGTDDGNPVPTADDDGNPLECSSNAECGECGECIDGACMEFPGCCAAVPDAPWQWRCSKPFECYGDDDCGDDNVCIGGECRPDEPDAPFAEPPTCGDDVVFELSAFGIDAPITQIAAATGSAGALVGVGEAGELFVLSPVEPPLLLGPVLDTGSLMLLDGGDAGVITVASTGADAEGSVYRVGRVVWQDGWVAYESEPYEGAPRHATTGGTGADLVAVGAGGFDLWALGDVPALSDQVVNADGVEAMHVASLADAGGNPDWYGISNSDGSLQLHDLAMGTVVDSGPAPEGTLVDLAAARDPSTGAAQLVALTHNIAGTPGDHWAVLNLIPVDPGLQATEQVGVLGEPERLVVSDVDGNGVDDLVVANFGGRLDLYLREQAGVICRASFLLDEVVDVVAVDSDGDGEREVVFVDTSSVYMIHGLAEG